MNKDYLKQRIPLLAMIFWFGGVFGFIYEEIFYRFDLGEWVKRGTTFGPWIPIYAFGGLLILAITFKVKKNPFLVFLLATVASGVLEYATGWALLQFFNTRLWDYNNEILNWGNINGFICLRSILFFGVSGVFLRFILVPIFEKLEKKLPKKLWLCLCFVPAAAFVVDIIASLIFKAVK